MQLSDAEQLRIDETLRYLPADVQSILEIGFSDGRMSEAFRRLGVRHYGLDLPREIVDSTKDNRVFGSIEKLPFRDRAVDLVVCCEVLEHLREKTYSLGLDELRRVADRYILITVPNNQRIASELSRCTHCGFVGHYSSHLRQFSEPDLYSLFPDWKLLKVVSFGPILPGYGPSWLYSIGFRLGTYDHRPWPCDHCGLVSEKRFPPLTARAVRSVLSRCEALSASRPAWLLGLWKRQKS